MLAPVLSGKVTSTSPPCSPLAVTFAPFSTDFILATPIADNTANVVVGITEARQRHSTVTLTALSTHAEKGHSVVAGQ